MASVIVREYNPDSGALAGNIARMSFGDIPKGTRSPVRVIDFAFQGVTFVNKVKLGLMHAGNVDVEEDAPTDITSDGTSANGNFGIEHTTSFDIAKAQGPVNRYFTGLNTTGLAGDSKNVEIGTRNDTTSQFVYLDIKAPSNVDGTAIDRTGSYRVFFDFE